MNLAVEVSNSLFLENNDSQVHWPYVIHCGPFRALICNKLSVNTISVISLLKIYFGKLAPIMQTSSLPRPPLFFDVMKGGCHCIGKSTFEQ